MSTITTTDLEGTVEDAAAHLYVWALKDIPQDLRDAISEALDRETSVPGRRVLETIIKNVEVAERETNLVCQDTGIAVYSCRVGEHFPLHPARIPGGADLHAPVHLVHVHVGGHPDHTPCRPVENGEGHHGAGRQQRQPALNLRTHCLGLRRAGVPEPPKLAVLHSSHQLVAMVD